MKVICPKCNCQFEAKKKRAQPKKIICLICKKEVFRKHEKAKYCSNKCKSIASSNRKYRVIKVCKQCKKQFELIGKGRKESQKRQFCSQICWYNYKRIEKKRNNGYIQIYVGKDYPGAKKNGRMWEHRFIMQKHIGRIIERSEVVHHKNGIKTENRIENLELVTPQLNTAYALLKSNEN